MLACYYIMLQVWTRVHHTTYPIGMREGLGYKETWKAVKDRKRFVSSLEVSNVFQYNARQTIIQLQSLFLSIQTSWFTYTVLLLSWKVQKTKRERLSGSEEGTLWLLNMACILLHTSHVLANIYNSAKFALQSQQSQTTGCLSQSAHLWSHMLHRDGKVQLLEQRTTGVSRYSKSLNWFLPVDGHCDNCHLCFQSWNYSSEKF